MNRHDYALAAVKLAIIVTAAVIGWLVGEWLAGN